MGIWNQPSCLATGESIRGQHPSIMKHLEVVWGADLMGLPWTTFQVTPSNETHQVEEQLVCYLCEHAYQGNPIACVDGRFATLKPHTGHAG